MSTETAAPERIDGFPIRESRVKLLVLAAVGIALIPIAGIVPVSVLILAAVGLALVAVAYAHPPAAAYILLTATPLTAGLLRSGLIPLLRPHELLGVLMGAGVALRAANHIRTGGRLRLRITSIDVAIVMMACAGSILPVLWMLARGLSPALEDLLYATAIWKFYGLFLVIRASVRTEGQVRRCLHLSVGAATVVALVAIMQALGVPAVVTWVSIIYPGDPLGGAGLSVGRGSATIGNPIAVGDVMAFNLAIALALLVRGNGSRRLLAPAAALLAIGGLASGQVSGVIALGVAVFTVAIVTGYVRHLFLALIPTTIVGAILLRPVVQERLSQIDISTGIPQSWQVRLLNLQVYIWPDLFSGQNWIFGVRPSTHIRVDAAWGPYIYIESGHTWLLWSGGLPLLFAFLFFCWAGIRTMRSVMRARSDSVGVAAVAGLAALVTTFILMSLDPHLTMRGTADLLFGLLALATAVRAVNHGDSDTRERQPAE